MVGSATESGAGKPTLGELTEWAGLLFLQDRAGAPLSPEQIACAGRVAERVAVAYPEHVADLSGFFRHVASVLPAEPAEPALVDALHVDGLYLCHAAARGEAWAFAAFRSEVWDELNAALGSIRIPAHHHDDVRQELWSKLFLGPGRPRILDYAGRGRLKSWFRVAATRALLDDRRRERAEGTRLPESMADELAAEQSDPELEHLKRLYGAEFRLAFEHAVSQLSAEDRNVLRSYYVQDLGIDEIATAFGIHRATAARRVNRARETLLTATRKHISEKLNLNPKELESVLRLIESRLYASVKRLLE